MTLEEKHRKAQLVLRATTLKELLRLWPAFDINDIPRTWDAFEEALLLLIRARGQTSSALARAYLREYGATVPNLAKLDEDQAIAGLKVMGPINATNQLRKGRTAEDVRATTLVNISGEVTRQIFNLGRATLLGGFLSSGTRWRRITDANPCSWCAEAAKGTHPASMPFGAHAHCACFPAPV